MQRRQSWFRAFALMIAVVFSLGLISVTGSQSVALAQNTHKSFLHQHKTVTSIAAGMAAYHAAKVTGNRRAAMGIHKNFAQRHPVLTGITAGIVTHHILKKTDHH